MLFGVGYMEYLLSVIIPTKNRQFYCLEAKKAPVFENAKIITRIYNWIDTEKFLHQNTDTLREKLGLVDKKIILCVASGWSNDKGLGTVQELSKKLTDNEQIVLVGNLPEGTFTGERIMHIPATNSVDELAELYSMADVFLQPSLEETFGKVTAEALSCGSPAVCFNSTANPELIGQGCGAVVAQGEVDEMLVKIRNIFNNGKCIYITDCRNFAVANFSKDTNLKRYEMIFGQLVGETL